VPDDNKKGGIKIIEVLALSEQSDDQKRKPICKKKAVIKGRITLLSHRNLLIIHIIDLKNEGSLV